MSAVNITHVAVLVRAPPAASRANSGVPLRVSHAGLCGRPAGPQPRPRTAYSCPGTPPTHPACTVARRVRRRDLPHGGLSMAIENPRVHTAAGGHSAHAGHRPQAIHVRTAYTMRYVQFHARSPPTHAGGG